VKHELKARVKYIGGEIYPSPSMTVIDIVPKLNSTVGIL